MRHIKRPMLLEHTSYREYLRALMASKIQENPAFSSRAMAKRLGVSPSTFCEVLKGRKNFSLEMATQVAIKLGLEDREKEYFTLLVQFESSRNPEVRAALQTKLQGLRPGRPKHDLGIDVFKLIADWYHLPILELTRLKGFKMEPHSIASRLGIKRVEAEAALERLLRLELLVRDEKGRLRKAQNHWVASSKIPSPALRKYHRQMLERAIESLEQHHPSERVIGSETFAISPEQIQEARAITEEFFSRMVALSAGDLPKSEVFFCGVQFFSLTKERK